MKSNKLEAKDLISIGIYTALYLVALFISSAANFTPLTFMFYPSLSSLLGATFFILLVSKVQKPGAIVIWGVLVGLLFLILGMAMTLPFAIVGAIIGQIIVSKANYKSYMAIIISYMIFSVCVIGGYIQLFVTTEEYLKEAANRGLAESFVNGIAEYATISFLVIVIVVTAVCALLGCLFARKILTKHLVKAGFIE
ncbi:MAG: MptD family putative ECF transporter S component [Lachnospiraceae bacterium]